jgi:hypothetical protein
MAKNKTTKKPATKKPVVKKSTKKTTSKTSTAKAAPTNKKTSLTRAHVSSPITPLLAVFAVFMTYVAFSMAIDSGSYWHYGAGFFFVYQAVRLTKVSISNRRNGRNAG